MEGLNPWVRYYPRHVALGAPIVSLLSGIEKV
jgi:hypothetical protein